MRITSVSILRVVRRDHSRRVRRAEFVGSILEEFEFHCEIKDDGLTARLEGYDQEVMKE